MQRLSDIARLDTCVTVVDALNFMSDYESPDSLADRKVAAFGGTFCIRCPSLSRHTRNRNASLYFSSLYDFVGSCIFNIVLSITGDPRNIVDLLVDQVRNVTRALFTA